MTALDATVGVVGYLALFAGIGFAFIFVNLLVGKFLRPHNPHREKLEIYECGEPAIGSSFVQFDLRFYVVALIFIIFDVEVAFMFPWATVFGKVANLRREAVAVAKPVGEAYRVSPAASGVYRELGATEAEIAGPVAQSDAALRHGTKAADGTMTFAGYDQILTFAFIEMGIFFVILLVAFAYEWRDGALDWVRAASSAPVRVNIDRPLPTRPGPHESVLSI